MGLFASKKQKQEATRRTEPVVRYAESPETQWMRDEMVRGVFNWYVADKPQHGEALWGLREMTHYFEEVECRSLTADQWARMLTVARLPPRAEAPWSSVDVAGLQIFFEANALRPERFYSVVDPISRCQRAEERQQELEKELGALAAKNASLKERCAGMNRRLRASIQWRERTDEAAASTLHSGASTISLDGTLTSIDGDSECAEMADVAALVHHQQRVPPTLAAVSALDAANRRL